MITQIPFFKQETDYSCGLASMRMVLSSLGIDKTEKELQVPMNYYSEGKAVWHKAFPNFAEQLKLTYVTIRNASLKDIENLIDQNFRIIVSYFIPKEKVDHYSVVRGMDSSYIYLLDSWFGPKHKYTRRYFIKNWFDLENEKCWLFGVKKNEN